jgi:hypothetical protein
MNVDTWTPAVRKRRLERIEQASGCSADEHDLVAEYRRIDLRLLVRAQLFFGTEQVEERVRLIRVAVERRQLRRPAEVDQGPYVPVHAPCGRHRDGRKRHLPIGDAQHCAVEPDVGRADAERPNGRRHAE